MKGALGDESDLRPIKQSRWQEWWHAIASEPAHYFKPPHDSWFGFARRRSYIEGYLEGLHDAARILHKHAWSKEGGHDERIRGIIKEVHQHHTFMERKHG